MQAAPPTESEPDSSQESDHDPLVPVQAPTTSSPPADCPSTDGRNDDGGDAGGMDAYRRLQTRLSLATALAIALVTPLTAWRFGTGAAISLLLGGLAGLLYLQLLSRSVSRLGVQSGSLGRVQLLVPVALVLLISRIPTLQIVPALVGFLLYKPAIFVQALLEA